MMLIDDSEPSAYATMNEEVLLTTIADQINEITFCTKRRLQISCVYGCVRLCMFKTSSKMLRITASKLRNPLMYSGGGKVK